MNNETELPLFHVCLPESDPDTWHEVRAVDAEQAAIEHAESECNSDPGCYRGYQDGEPMLVRADGQNWIQRVEVTVESVPVFSARKTGTCG